MLLRLRNSAEAMTTMVRHQERTANNLANSGTIGFKKDRAFVEVLNQRLDEEGAPRSERVDRQWVDFAAGTMERTGNPFDLGIEGDGFFVLTDNETGTERYTRAGRFTPDVDGNLRAPNGLLLTGDDGPLQMPADASQVEFGTDGTIRADGRLVGRVRLVDFEDRTQLTRVDGAAFEAGEDEPVEATARLLQGFVEQSNADPLQEMTGMIEHLRLFEMQQRMLRSTDENLAASVRSLGRF